MDITRREMMQRLGALAVAAGAADRALGSRSAAATTGWKPGDPIGYRRKTIPEFNIPAYQGDRYEALVPDTLDLAGRARWALNALTETTDPKADCEIYGGVLYDKNPAWMGHDFSDHGQPRYIETTPLLRIATGSDLNAHVDRAWIESALRMIGEDGLAWTPLVGRPWGTIGMESGTCVPEGIDISAFAEYLDATLNGGLLNALTVYYKRDRNDLWKQTAERMVDGLGKVVVDKGRYAYYSPNPHFVIPGSTDDWGRRHPMWGVGSDAVHGMLFLYRETGYEPSLRLAGKLMNYVLDEIQHIAPDGSYTPDAKLNHASPARFDSSSFGGHSEYVYHTLEYGLLAKDQEMIERAHSSYEYSKRQGDLLTGYFPEWVYHDDRASKEWGNSEACALTHLISAALLFNNNGLADLWDDIDPWVRNQFVENQLSPARSDMMMRQAAKQEKWTPGLYVSTERLQERAVGTFTGTPRINEWGSGMSNCCIASGARCVYQVWKNILREQDGKLKINLPLNRASKWADVDSHIPYTGRVDVHVKEPVELSIRIPKWVKPAEARVQVVNTVARASNTIQDREVEWDGRYVKVGRVNPRDVVKLTFPIGERSEQSAVLPERSTLIIKGNEVVAVSPPGISCPTYQREHYRTDTTRWRNTQRFVSREELDW